MRVTAHGDTFTVHYSPDDAAAFADEWPGSTVEGAGSFTFETRTGDLVDTSGTAATGPCIDPGAGDWLAFSDDCYLYGAKIVHRGRLLHSRPPTLKTRGLV